MTAAHQPSLVALRSDLRVLKGQLGVVIDLFTVVTVLTLWLVLRIAAKLGAWPEAAAWQPSAGRAAPVPDRTWRGSGGR